RHQVRHQRRRHKPIVISPLTFYQPAVEKFSPLTHHEIASWAQQRSTRHLTRRLAIDDQQPTPGNHTSVTSPGKLSQVERAVAAATDDGYLAELVHQRLSRRPPSTMIV